MQNFTIKASLLFIESGQLEDFTAQVMALDAQSAYDDLLHENPPDQSDLFAQNFHIGDRVLFCGMVDGNGSWCCPITGGKLQIRRK